MIVTEWTDWGSVCRQGPAQAGKKKKGKAPAGPVMKAATLVFHVNKQYPKEDEDVLKFLQAHYDKASNSFPKDLVNLVRADENLIPKGDKKKMQKVRTVNRTPAHPVTDRALALGGAAWPDLCLPATGDEVHAVHRGGGQGPGRGRDGHHHHLR